MSQILWFTVAIRDYDNDEDGAARDIEHALDDYGLSVWSGPQLTGTSRNAGPRLLPGSQAVNVSGVDMGEIAAKLFTHYGDDAHVLTAKEKELLQKKTAEMLARQLADGS